jgi:hypothetical protein
MPAVTASVSFGIKACNTCMTQLYPAPPLTTYLRPTVIRLSSCNMTPLISCNCLPLGPQLASLSALQGRPSA